MSGTSRAMRARWLLIGVLGICTAQAHAKSTCLNCPQILLELAPDGQGKEILQLQESGLQYLSTLVAPVHIVPILGIYRSGKSMLLNHVSGCRCFAAAAGDQTVTRGIFMCAEPLPDEGTVVWMDTEGLFSSEDSASKLGPRISTLALLMSSAVMLNTMHTYDDRWVNFFDEQQRMAHILREQLDELPEEAKSLMMPRKLPLFWVLSRPQDPTADQSKSLEKFLQSKPWRDDFEHVAHMVPSAVDRYDRAFEAWSLPDSELNPAYLVATQQLREKVLSVVHAAHGMSPQILILQLNSFMNLVNNDNFNPDDAVQIFQQDKIENLTAAITAPRPECSQCSIATIKRLKEALKVDVDKAFQLQQAYVQKFKFGASWLTKSEKSIRDAELNVIRTYLRRCWRFGPAIKPFIPWIVGLYFRHTSDRFLSIMKRIATHAAIFFALSVLDISTVLLWFGVNTATGWYEQTADSALSTLAQCVRVTPSIIFAQVDNVLAAVYVVGICWAVYRVLLFWAYRPSRMARSINKGVGNVENKISDLENQADYAVKRHLASSATAAARHLQDGSAPRAADALFEGLVGLREATLNAGSRGTVLRGLDPKSKALRQAKKAVGAYQGSAQLFAGCNSNKLLAHTAAGEWEKLVSHMADLLLQMEGEGDVPSPPSLPSVASAPLPRLSDFYDHATLPTTSARTAPPPESELAQMLIKSA
eukprot:TRINITY_DN23809_c1_g3_i1.p1 TRINITY_DN23809_c1_g3~~TRINITY_DN23809_c1_g3_i1.p1  ORF type:complete len:704 (+),score=91.90 TRINITY_DN23809_c1_g3_i1:26-2137(+)